MIALQNDRSERPQATPKVVGWDIKRPKKDMGIY
jgi:hypothetical protein